MHEAIGLTAKNQGYNRYSRQFKCPIGTWYRLVDWGFYGTKMLDPDLVPESKSNIQYCVYSDRSKRYREAER